MNGMQDIPIGDRIKLYRRRRGLSQPKLAQLIGRSESWLSQVERGVRSVDRLSTIIELSRVLRVPVIDLTGRPLSLAPNGGAHFEAVDALRRALMSHSAMLAVEVGDPDETIRLGQGLDTSRLPVGIRGRRSAVLIDLARGYAMRRMDAAAVNMLLDAERIASEAVRFNVLVHESRIQTPRI